MASQEWEQEGNMLTAMPLLLFSLLKRKFYEYVCLSLYCCVVYLKISLCLEKDCEKKGIMASLLLSALVVEKKRSMGGVGMPLLYICTTFSQENVSKRKERAGDNGGTDTYPLGKERKAGAAAAGRAWA